MNKYLLHLTNSAPTSNIILPIYIGLNIYTRASIVVFEINLLKI